jgi:hypothetical protein
MSFFKVYEILIDLLANNSPAESSVISITSVTIGRLKVVV